MSLGAPGGGAGQSPWTLAEPGAGWGRAGQGPQQAGTQDVAESSRRFESECGATGDLGGKLRTPFCPGLPGLYSHMSENAEALGQGGEGVIQAAIRRTPGRMGQQWEKPGQPHSQGREKGTNSGRSQKRTRDHGGPVGSSVSRQGQRGPSGPCGSAAAAAPADHARARCPNARTQG